MNHSLKNQKPLQGMSMSKNMVGAKIELGMGHHVYKTRFRPSSHVTCKILRISTQAPCYVTRLTCQIIVAVSMAVHIQKIQIPAPHLLTVDHLQYAE